MGVQQDILVMYGTNEVQRNETHTIDFELSVETNLYTCNYETLGCTCL